MIVNSKQYKIVKNRPIPAPTKDEDKIRSLITSMEVGDSINFSVDDYMNFATHLSSIEIAEGKEFLIDAELEAFWRTK